MNMKQFRYVLVLSTEGSVSAAAAALGISQPSLSQYLKKIESEVNATLFDRSGSVLRLTDAGRVYIDAGKRILDIEHQMQGRIADINDYKSGTLTVGIAPYRAVYLMPRVVDTQSSPSSSSATAQVTLEARPSAREMDLTCRLDRLGSESV